MVPSCYDPYHCARFVCWRRAALFGGKLLIHLPLVVDMCFLARFTVISVQVQSYKSTTNASNTDMQSLLNSYGSVNKVENTGVTSLKDVRMSKSQSFPPASKRRHSITTRKGMERGKGECLFISKFFSDVMRRNVPQVFASAKSDPDSGVF